MVTGRDVHARGKGFAKGVVDTWMLFSFNWTCLLSKVLPELWIFSTLFHPCLFSVTWFKCHFCISLMQYSTRAV